MKDISQELVKLAKSPYVQALLSDFAVFFGIDTIKSLIKREPGTTATGQPKEAPAIYDAFLAVTDPAKKKLIVEWFKKLSNHDKRKVSEIKKETLDKLFLLSEDEMTDFVNLLGDSPLEALVKWAQHRETAGDPPMPKTRAILKRWGDWGRAR